MKEKLRLLLRKPAVIALLIAELLVIGFALAAALRPVAAYTFTADQWENIAQESEIGYDEDGRIGVTEMTDGEDILQTPPMTLPKGHYTITLDYRYVPSVWEGGVERRSCVYFTSYDAVHPGSLPRTQALAAGRWGKRGDGGCAALCYEKEKE